MTIQNGGAARFTGNYTTAASATYNITGAGSTLQVLAGNLVINNGSQVNLASGGMVDASGTVIVGDEGTLQAGSPINRPIAGTSFDAVINVTASGVSLGSAASLSGFEHQGVLNVGANTVTLNSAGYARLGALTTLAGGTISAPNGITFGSGADFLGNGAVNARVTGGDLGSVVEADGALSLGDPTSRAGFTYGGELRTKQFAVTLSSSGNAALGNFTALGTVASSGTLNAPNGYVVDFGEAVTGFGTVNSTNALAKAAVINGAVQGNSVSQPITLSGYIKGLGTFNNTTFTGTFSPGLSATLVSAGSIALAPTSTLIMEVGGTTPGNSFDRIQATGSLTLSGTLQLVLIGGFAPAAGNSFDILDWGTLNGTFATLQLPTLAGGLVWNTSQLYTAGVLSVGLPGDFNSNGVVDAADYAAWRKGLGTNYTQGDYDTWRAHFGQTAISGSGASADAAVPEPASPPVLLLGLLVMCTRRLAAAS